MIFQLLIYSSIFFITSLHGYSHYPASSPALFSTSPNIFFRLPDEEATRFSHALTNICQNIQKMESDDLAHMVKNILNDRECYERFVIIAVHKIESDKKFAHYLDSIKINKKKTLCSFLISEFDRLKQSKFKTRLQKHLAATAHMVKKKSQILRTKVYVSDYADEIENQDEIILYSSFHDPAYQGSGGCHLGPSRTRLPSTNLRKIEPTTTQNNNHKKQQAPDVKKNNNAYLKSVCNQIIGQKQDDYAAKFAKNNPNSWSVPHITLFSPYPEEFSLVYDDPNGILIDEQLSDLKKELRFIQDSSSKDRLLEVIKKTRCDNVQRFDDHNREEARVNYQINQNVNYTNQAFRFLEFIKINLFNLFSDKSSNISLLDRETALFDILSSSWPSNLPRNSTLERAFNNLKYDLQQLMYDAEGNPILNDTIGLERKKAKAVIDFLLLSYGMTPFFEEVLNQGIARSKIHYLHQAFIESQSRPGRLGATGRLLYDMVSGVSEFAHELIFGQPNRAREINNNSITQDLNLRRIAFLEGDLIKAFEIADKYWGTPYYKKMIEPLKETFFKDNTIFGIPKIFSEDPLYTSLPKELKDELHANLPSFNSNSRFNYHKLEKLHELRSQLIDRRIIVQELSRVLDVDYKKSQAIKKLFYDLADDMQGKAYLSDRIDLINNLTEKYSFDSLQGGAKKFDNFAYDLFFDDNGRCKLIPADPRLFENINFDSNISSFENVNLRKLVNYFSSIDRCMPEARDSIRQGLKYCAQASRGGELAKDYENLAEAVFLENATHAKKSSMLIGNFADGDENQIHKHLVRLAGDIGSKFSRPNDFKKSDLDKALGMLEAARRLNNNNHKKAAENLLLSDVFLDVAQRYKLPNFQNVLDDYYSNKFGSTQGTYEYNKFDQKIQQNYDSWQKSGKDIDNFVENLVRDLERLNKDFTIENCSSQEYENSDDDESSDDDNDSGFTSLTSLIDEDSILPEEDGPYDQEISRETHEAIQLVKGLTKGIFDTTLNPLLHPIQTAQAIKELTHLALDLTLHRLAVLEAYYTCNHKLTPTDKKEMENFLNQCELMDLYIWDNFSQAADHLYNNATTQERAEFVGNIVGLWLGPAKCISLATRAGAVSSKALLNLGRLLAEQSMAERFALTMEELGVPEGLIQKTTNLAKIASEADRIEAGIVVAREFMQIAETARHMIQPARLTKELSYLNEIGIPVAERLKEAGTTLGRYGVNEGQSLTEYYQELTSLIGQKNANQIMEYAAESCSVDMPIYKDLIKFKPTNAITSSRAPRLSNFHAGVATGKIKKTGDLAHKGTQIDFSLPPNALRVTATDPTARALQIKSIEKITQQLVLDCTNKNLKKVMRKAFNNYVQDLKKPLCDTHGAPTLKRYHSYTPENLKPLIPDLVEIEKLSKPYNGTIKTPEIENYKQMPVDINYLHIFTPEITIDCKKGRMRLSGFHHDPDGAIEKSGILDIKHTKKLPGGAYEVIVGYGLAEKPSGMFPQEWSRSKVIEKAIEAYNNPVYIDYSASGNEYLVCGQTKEGMNILWVFEVENEAPTGKNISVYPVEKILKKRCS